MSTPVRSSIELSVLEDEATILADRLPVSRSNAAATVRQSVAVVWTSSSNAIVEMSLVAISSSEGTTDQPLHRFWGDKQY